MVLMGDSREKYYWYNSYKVKVHLTILIILFLNTKFKQSVVL